MATENLGRMFRDLGRHVDALAMFERVLEIRNRALPANHPRIGEGHVWSDALHGLCRL